MLLLNSYQFYDNQTSAILLFCRTMLCIAQTMLSVRLSVHHTLVFYWNG